MEAKPYGVPQGTEKTDYLKVIMARTKPLSRKHKFLGWQLGIFGLILVIFEFYPFGIQSKNGSANSHPHNSVETKTMDTLAGKIATYSTFIVLI